MIPSDVPDSAVRGCPDMWLEFTCICPKFGNQGVKVEMPNGTYLKSTGNNAWIDFDDRLSLYYNTTSKTVRLRIKKLHTKDFGTYKCFPSEEDSSAASSDEEDATREVKEGEVPPRSD